MRDHSINDEKITIPLAEPNICGNEWKYVKDCLDSCWVSYSGSYVDKFENALKEKTGAQFSIATNCGTSALHISLILSGIKPDDDIIMPGISFVSPANAIRYCGAWPVFIDIDEKNWQIDINKVVDFIENECVYRNKKLINRHTDRVVSALLPVHLLGGMCDVDAITEIAEKYQLALIEDAAQCLGAIYKGRPIAASLNRTSSLKRFVITSFNGNKIITTGGGGCILTDDPELAKQAKHLTTTAKLNDFEYFHDQIGYNYRLTNLSAALGLGQLEMLESFIENKQNIAKRYAQAFTFYPQITPHSESKDVNSIYWMYTIMFDRNSRDIAKKLLNARIMTRPIWKPLFQLPAFQQKCFHYHCDFSHVFYERALSLPCSTGLNQNQQGKVIKKITDIINSEKKRK